MEPHSLEVFVEEANVNLYAWQLIAHGFSHSQRLKAYTSYTTKVQTAHIQNDYGRSAFDRKNWAEFGNALLKKLEHQEIPLDKLIADHHELGSSIKKIATKIQQADLSKTSDNEMKQRLEQMWEDYIELNGVGLIPVASDYHHGLLSSRCEKIISRRARSTDERQQALNVLMSPDRATEAWHEQSNLLTLVLKFPRLEELEKSSDLLLHVNRYATVNYGYQGPELKKEDVLLRAKKFYERYRDLPKEQQQHLKHFKNLKASQRQYEQTLQLTDEERYMLESARTFTYLKAYRVDIRHIFHRASDLVFRELGRRYDLPINWFRYAERPEILAVLSGATVDADAVLRRRANVLVVFTETGDEFIPPERIKDFYDTYVYEEKIQETEIVNGQSAFLGKVQGIARIIHNASEIFNVKHGDILVAATTNPDLLPAMYRASAFVTDSGGITSHAAIVAREMKKPCVIGTKVATKIFHDGDTLEVDANNGVVKVLKRA